MRFIRLMVKNNIEVLAIPSHTSHVLQPLDSTPFANFKTAWNNSLIEYLFKNVGCKMTKQDFWVVFWPAWHKSMTTAVIQSGFWKTGVFPYNPDMIKHSALAPSTLQTTSHKLKARIVCGVKCFRLLHVCGCFRFLCNCFGFVDCFPFFLGFVGCFSSFCRLDQIVLCFFTDQARAIHDKVAAGGVGVQGAVGGVQMAGGVVVAQPPHYPGDNDGESDEDSSVSYTKTLSSVHFVYMYISEMFP